ncbi:hypothetical protein [Lacihabitans soyangensis]|uniref:hypothetical protein n=1 Tax=Lacihabitans soyangensis TaxID=869394 RepID=UPI0020CD4989|nr:hypothetical protein [Lacihabitans soyangensis]
MAGIFLFKKNKYFKTYPKRAVTIIEYRYKIAIFVFYDVLEFETQTFQLLVIE